ncbi:MAG: hypothetical protein PF961_08905 [Planctomycetota bacterium]|jgi:hypothetical protein|nr:hypothetical protein [Planctomycetota bacterium]
MSNTNLAELAMRGSTAAQILETARDILLTHVDDWGETVVLADMWNEACWVHHVPSDERWGPVWTWAFAELITLARDNGLSERNVGYGINVWGR